MLLDLDVTRALELGMNGPIGIWSRCTQHLTEMGPITIDFHERRSPMPISTPRNSARQQVLQGLQGRRSGRQVMQVGDVPIRSCDQMVQEQLNDLVMQNGRDQIGGGRKGRLEEA